MRPHLVEEKIVEEEVHHGFGGHAVEQVNRARMLYLAGLHGQGIQIMPAVGPLMWMPHPVWHERGCHHVEEYRSLLV